jgi:hypothetical protein
VVLVGTHSDEVTQANLETIHTTVKTKYIPQWSNIASLVTVSNKTRSSIPALQQTIIQLASQVTFFFFLIFFSLWFFL